jgi:hypothetical protein
MLRAGMYLAAAGGLCRGQRMLPLAAGGVSGHVDRSGPVEEEDLTEETAAELAPPSSC